MLKDADIRIPLYERLRYENLRHTASFRIIPELTICDGFARVDVAVANGNLSGYEIKSDADTLERLSSQQQYYDITFDKMFIIVGKKFSSCIDTVIPSWWGIYIATETSKGKILLSLHRTAKKNKNVSSKSLLELLWHSELITLLQQNNIKGISGKNRRLLRQIALDNISDSTIRTYTRETLKTRSEWRFDNDLNFSY